MPLARVAFAYDMTPDAMVSQMAINVSGEFLAAGMPFSCLKVEPIFRRQRLGTERAISLADQTIKVMVVSRVSEFR
ncbi:hypothetical protein GWE18_38385 [Bradyrhizobium sp. CSA112]|uniref:hypothetical protein n=1 Tax=Bradyrhizobium sp. CSA112 TaxID=2699170 RepID=UPI0023B09C18|nr:hypothetical protein [Bradyrhizobium sp. CSA112]MDE5458545.1 hypothetical protein [Bradyrhizobium sp. CSA112]